MIHFHHATLPALLCALPLSLAVSSVSTWNGAGDGATWGDADNWAPAQSPNSPTADVVIDMPNAIVQHNVATEIHALRLEPSTTLALLNGWSMEVNGGPIDNAGSIVIGGGAHGTGIFLAPGMGDLSLIGSGTIALSDSSTNIIHGFVGTDRFINEDNTIQGSGMLGNFQIGLTNRGLVTANQATPLIFRPSNAGGVNSGTLRAEGSGTLSMHSSTLNFEGSDPGLIEVLDSATLHVPSGTHITGGLITIKDSGEFQLGGAFLTGGNVQVAEFAVLRTIEFPGLLSGVVDNAGLFHVQNGTGLIFDASGAYSNQGEIRLDSTGSHTQLSVQGGEVVLGGGGLVHLSNNSQNEIRGSQPTDRFVNQDNTIRGAGHIGGNLINVTNRGTIEADQTTPIWIDASQDIINEGTLLATGAGGLLLEFGPFTTSGAVVVGPSSKITRTGNYVQAGGSTTVNGELELTQSGHVDLQRGVLTGDGSIDAPVDNRGDVLPGAAVGQLSLVGDYTQFAEGTLTIDIEAPGQFDVLAIQGDAFLAGTLRVDLGYEPSFGDEFTILTTTGTVQGQFDPIPCFEIVYDPQSVRVVPLTSIGVNFCGPAVPNSSGNSGVIVALGSDRVADNCVTLSASGLALNQFSYFVTSQTQGFVNPPGSQGNLCLGGTIGRYSADVLFTGVDGAVSLPIDLQSLPLGGGTAVLPGQTWNFQLWFRDVGSTSNFTDGVAVLFQ